MRKLIKRLRNKRAYFTLKTEYARIKYVCVPGEGDITLVYTTMDTKESPKKYATCLTLAAVYSDKYSTSEEQLVILDRYACFGPVLLMPSDTFPQVEDVPLIMVSDFRRQIEKQVKEAFLGMIEDDDKGIDGSLITNHEALDILSGIETVGSIADKLYAEFYKKNKKPDKEPGLCPNCKSENVAATDNIEYDLGGHYCICKNCGFAQTKNFRSRESAIAAWNLM